MTNNSELPVVDANDIEWLVARLDALWSTNERPRVKEILRAYPRALEDRDGYKRAHEVEAEAHTLTIQENARLKARNAELVRRNEGLCGALQGLLPHFLSRDDCSTAIDINTAIAEYGMEGK